MPLDVPDAVKSTAMALGASQWLEGLAGMLADLEREWSITLGRTYRDGHEAFVAEVTMSDGAPAVLKVLVPRGDNAPKHEITVLRLAGGEGCAQLYRSDEARGALLMERLGRPLSELSMSLAQQHEILCALARRLWRPAPESGLPTGAEKGRWLADFISRTWEDIDRPCSEQVVDHALSCVDRRIRAHDDERAVLVHGDVHQWNALEAGDGFKLVDPDGLLAQPEYDLGLIMRADPVELLRGDPQERARWLAARTGLDAAAIWEWGVIERVSSGLLCTSLDLQPSGRDMLVAAERIAREFRE